MTSRSPRGARPPRAAGKRGAARPPSRPDAIRFGTNGWRGALGEEVSFPRLRVLTRAIAQWLREEAAGERVLIGWDGRFASRAMAEIACDVLEDEGLRPVLADRSIPTPVVTHALSRGRHAAGIVLTASHNPPADHGLKLFDASGASIPNPPARRIEAIAARRMRDDAPAPAGARRRVRALAENYLAALEALLDREALRGGKVTLAYDAMHGAAAGLLDGLMSGLGVSVVSLRGTPDPTFGGAAPDPIPANLAALVACTRAQSAPALGIAHDGDGDRVGVVDGGGRVLSETQVIALLVDHLARRGRIRRGVAIGAATGTLVEKVARAHGLGVERHPIGFKALSSALAAGRADAAGEESGGFALAEMGLDKDGILAGALLVELVATTGVPLEAHLERLERQHGPSACGRIARPRTAAVDRALARLASDPPERVGRVRVLAVDARDGLRLALADGGFLMFRRSGTESLARLYAEAGDPQRLAQRLRDGTRLLERAGR